MSEVSIPEAELLDGFTTTAATDAGASNSNLDVESAAKPPEKPTEVVYTPEQKRLGERMLALKLRAQSKLTAILADRDVKEGLSAVSRLVGNSILASAEIVPFFGNLAPLIVDLANAYQDATANAADEEKLSNLTPDVDEKITILTTALGFIPFFPGHLVDLVLQLKADIPRIKEGTYRVMEIIQLDAKAELAYYAEHKQELDDALKAFGIEPPKI